MSDGRENAEDREKKLLAHNAAATAGAAPAEEPDE